MKCDWMLWCQTSSERKARKVAERFADAIGCVLTESFAIKADPDVPGHIVRFRSDVKSVVWNDAIVEVIGTGQKVADQWTLMGAVTSSLSATARYVKIPGVALTEWTIDAPHAV